MLDGTNVRTAKYLKRERGDRERQSKARVSVVSKKEKMMMMKTTQLDVQRLRLAARQCTHPSRKADMQKPPPPLLRGAKLPAVGSADGAGCSLRVHATDGQRSVVYSK